MRFIDIILHEFRIDMPADGEGMGIPRKKMPQIKTKDYPEYFQYLKDNDVDFQKLDGVKAATLKPTQSEFSKQGVEKQLQKMWDKNDSEKPLIASSDDYIIDGHHRWLVAKNTRRPLTVFKADVPMKELMALTLKFPKVYYKDIYNEGYKIQLERDPNMYVLHITDTKSGKRTEVRGKSGYESGSYDADDRLHQLLDKIGKSANISELINGEVVTINPKHPDATKANKAADTAFNEDVSVPKNVFHMKNRLLKVKKITDELGNRPIMFRSFVYDAEPVAKIIKKVTNDTGRKIKTGSNQKQQEVLQKLGIENPTFTAMATSKYANIRRDSLEDLEVAGMQNIFIPLSNEMYYSDTIEDLGMGRSKGGRNISLPSDFDVDKAVATYKKGWPPAGFDNEIIVDTTEYYLLNLRSFLLELTSPEIKSQIGRLKSMYDKSYGRKAEENHINDILKDLFKTKITTYGDISRWIESVAIPFVDMLASNRGEPTKNTYTAYDDDDDSWLDSLDDIGKSAFNEAAGVGRVVKGVNTTVDVGPDEIIKQVKKFGNDVDRDGFPKKHLR